MRKLCMGFVMGAAVLASGATWGVDVPQYKLEPGQVLTYETKMTWHKEKGEQSGQDEIVTISVVRKSGDGWKVVTEQKQTFWQGKRPEGASTQPANDRTSMGTGIVHADGRSETTDDNAIGDPIFRGNPLGVLVALPATAADAGGYSAKLPGSHGTLEAKVLEQGDKEWVIETARVSPDDAIYLASNKSKVHFDVSRGLPVRWDLTSRFDYRGNESGEGTCELKNIDTKDVAALAQLAQDVERSQAALKAYETAMENLKGDDGEMKKQAQAAIDGLKAAAPDIQTSAVRADLLTMVPRHDQELKYAIDGAQRKAKVEGQPAAEWELDRIGGGKTSLASLRGKVVILDFWYRGCGWCMKAMPEIKQVAADYKDKGVVVLGMNIDKDEKDAQMVIDKMGLNYDTLKTPDDLPAKYGVRGYPTLIVIDREGIVRKMHVGYSATLRTDLGEVLDGLLKG